MTAMPDTGYIHPMRYPKHEDPEKGQLFDGVCNVTRCDRSNARHWNVGTRGLYCWKCAEGINWHPGEPDLCILVEEKPSKDRMDEMEQEMYAKMRR